MTRAFSLVELSIVLVILGLLTGGILAGQSLIRASELRAVSTEFNRYSAANNTFRDKYFGLPGDFTNATRFWGRKINHAACVTNSSAAVNATTGTCDGTGDGLLFTGWNGGGNQFSEGSLFWQHLALAGLIEGTYPGTDGLAQFSKCVVGQCPSSKLGGSVLWHAQNRLSQTKLNAGAQRFNLLSVGKVSTNIAYVEPVYGALRPEEAWNVDTKMDDGKPRIGVLHAVRFFDPDQSAACSNPDDYSLTVTTQSCSLEFELQ